MSHDHWHGGSRSVEQTRGTGGQPGWGPSRFGQEQTQLASQQLDYLDPSATRAPLSHSSVVRHTQAYGPAAAHCCHFPASPRDSASDIGVERAARRLQHASTARLGRADARSEEHTSELQSHSDLVCRLLLEKKNHVLGPYALSYGHGIPSHL